MNQNPTVTVNSPTKCANDPAVNINATPSPAGTYNYTWSVPGTSTSPGNLASFNTLVGGTYSVTITNPATGCTGKGSGILTVNPNPVISLSASPASINLATVSSTQLGIQSITPGIITDYNYSWIISNKPAGSNASLTNGNTASPVLNILSPYIAGIYTVQVTATNKTTGCANIAALDITDNGNLPHLPDALYLALYDHHHPVSGRRSNSGVVLKRIGTNIQNRLLPCGRISSPPGNNPSPSS